MGQLHAPPLIMVLLNTVELVQFVCLIFYGCCFSYSGRCTTPNRASVFTRVSYYLDWIHETARTLNGQL